VAVACGKWKNAMRDFSGGEQKPRPKKSVPPCGALVGITRRAGHECGASLRFSLAALSKKLSGVFGEQGKSRDLGAAGGNILMFGISWVAMASEPEAVVSGSSGDGWRDRLPFGSKPLVPIFYEHQWWRLCDCTMFLLAA